MTANDSGVAVPSIAHIKVVWHSGNLRTFIFGSRRVLLDGSPVPALDKEFETAPGPHRICVHSAWVRSNELEVTLAAGEAVTLECEVTLAAFAACVWGVIIAAAAAVLPPLALAHYFRGLSAVVVPVYICAGFPVFFLLATKAGSTLLSLAGHRGLVLRQACPDQTGATPSPPTVDDAMRGFALFGAMLLGAALGVGMAPRAAGMGQLALAMFLGALAMSCAAVLLLWAAQRFFSLSLAKPLGLAVIGALAGFFLLPVVIRGTVTERHLWIPGVLALSGAVAGVLRFRTKKAPPDQGNGKETELPDSRKSD